MEKETLELFLTTYFAQFRQDLRACFLYGPVSKVEERIEELAAHYEKVFRAGVTELIVDKN